MIERKWAFWRRVQYGTLFGVLLLGVFSLVYFTNFYQAPNCFDQRHNGSEAGVDCGGTCTRICAFSVTAPTVRWAESFKVSGDQYNAVGYIDNQNQTAASPAVEYTFTLYDDQGPIIQQSGSTILPPNSAYPVFAARIDTNGRVPTRTELSLEPVEVWVPATTGREQFRITGRQLLAVGSRPRLEATIENTDLRPVEEVEVVATIFDMSGNPLTASRTFVDNFAARSEEQIVFTWPEPIASTLRSCDVPTDVVLAIDLSGSMNNDGGTPPEPISSVLVAAQSFTNRLRASDQASLVTFATESTLRSPLSSDKAEIAGQISDLSIAPAEETGSTNTGAAVSLAYQELSSGRHNQSARQVLVLLTDGLATAPEENPEIYALEAAAQARAAGVIVYTIGLGEQVNMAFLRSLASSNQHAYKAVTRSQIDQIYQTITSDICEDGPAVIDIVPKSDAGFQKLR